MDETDRLELCGREEHSETKFAADKPECIFGLIPFLSSIPFDLVLQSSRRAFDNLSVEPVYQPPLPPNPPLSSPAVVFFPAPPPDPPR